MFSPYYAYKKNWIGEEIGWQPGTEEALQWTASFGFAINCETE